MQARSASTASPDLVVGESFGVETYESSSVTGAKQRAAKPHDKEMQALENAADVSSAVGDGYTPTAKEAEAIKRTQVRLAARPPFPGFTTKVEGGVAKIAIEHKDGVAAVALQLNAVGVATYQEFSSILASVFNFTMRKPGEPNPDAATEAMHLIVGIAPQNTTEALLATQMAAIHLATMEAARKLNTSPGTVDAIAVNSKVLNNLARTFTMQTEALKKLRAGGTQRVVVEHKHYHLHQAPDGSIKDQTSEFDPAQGGGAGQETEHQPHERGIPERQAMLGHLEANGLPLPGAGGEGLECVSIPRGERGSAGRSL